MCRHIVCVEIFYWIVAIEYMKETNITKDETKEVAADSTL
jgi:hypothetical protein